MLLGIVGRKLIDDAQDHSMSMKEWLKRALARFAATIAAKEAAMSDKQNGVTLHDPTTNAKAGGAAVLIGAVAAYLHAPSSSERRIA